MTRPRARPSPRRTRSLRRRTHPGAAKRSRPGRRPIGVYWGRFNPPHRGHLAVVRRLERRGRLVIAIGSAERRNERRNPFSGRERQTMFRSYLREAGVRGVRVVALRDGPSLSWAVRNLVRTCRPDVLFLSDEKSPVARAVTDRVRVVPFARTGNVSSSRIRDLIARGDPGWKRLTGRSVARFIESSGGDRRIRRIYGRARRRTRTKGSRDRPVRATPLVRRGSDVAPR